MDKDRERNRENVGGEKVRKRETSLRAHTRVEARGGKLRRRALVT